MKCRGKWVVRERVPVVRVFRVSESYPEECWSSKNRKGSTHTDNCTILLLKV